MIPSLDPLTVCVSTYCPQIRHIKWTHLTHELHFGVPCCKSRQLKRPLVVSIDVTVWRAYFCAVSCINHQTADRDTGQLGTRSHTFHGPAQSKCLA